MITEREIENWFTYHFYPEDIVKYTELRNKAREFALTVLRLTPPSADQTAAIRKIREAVMTANAAIACDTNSNGPKPQI